MAGPDHCDRERTWKDLIFALEGLKSSPGGVAALSLRIPNFFQNESIAIDQWLSHCRAESSRVSLFYEKSSAIDSVEQKRKAAGLSVQTTPDRGRIIVAQRDFIAGDIVFEEEAFMLSALPTLASTLSGFLPPPDDVRSQYSTSPLLNADDFTEIEHLCRRRSTSPQFVHYLLFLLDLPLQQKQRVLQLFCPETDAGRWKSHLDGAVRCFPGVFLSIIVFLKKMNENYVK